MNTNTWKKNALSSRSEEYGRTLYNPFMDKVLFNFFDPREMRPDYAPFVIKRSDQEYLKSLYIFFKCYFYLLRKVIIFIFFSSECTRKVKESAKITIRVINQDVTVIVKSRRLSFTGALANFGEELEPLK